MHHTNSPEGRQNKHTIPVCLLLATFLLHCEDPLEWDAATHNQEGLPTSIKIQTKHAYTRSMIEPQQAVFINLEYEGIMYRQLMKTEGMDWKESKQDYMGGPEGGK